MGKVTGHKLVSEPLSGLRSSYVRPRQLRRTVQSWEKEKEEVTELRGLGSHQFHLDPTQEASPQLLLQAPRP